MRKRKYSVFDRWWYDLDFGSVSRYVLLPIIGPVLIVRLVLYGILALVIFVIVLRSPGALGKVVRSYRNAEAMGQTDHDSTRLKGGGHRQVGSNCEGSLVRPGGPLSSDDLRRRLYELRASQKERKKLRTPNKGGHYGEQ